MNFINMGKSPPVISEYARHKHQNFEIVFVLSGVSKAKIGAAQYHLSAGDIVIIPPMTEHTGTAEQHYADLFFTVRECGFHQITVLHDRHHTVKHLTEMLYRTYLEKEMNYPVLLECLTDTILQYLKSFSADSAKYAFITALKKSIYDNIANADFVISDAIKQQGYNVDYCRRCFNEEVGQTPVAFLNELRIETAKILLSHEKYLKIETVAKYCGFQDQFYFSKKFKQLVGVSPKYYKKRLETAQQTTKSP